MIRIAFLFAAVALFSCSGMDSETCTEVKFTDAFTVETGETYCLEDGTELEITALNNEFCPCFAVCVWEGEMTINMTWTMPDAEVIEYLFHAGAPSVNEKLPNGIVVLADQEEIETEFPCTETSPSPAIISAVIVVNN